MGCLGTLVSYTKKHPKPTKPKTRGITTLADRQGNCMPPHVRPMAHDVILATKIIFPLVCSEGLSAVRPGYKLRETYNQSTRLILSLKVPSGTRSLRKAKTRAAANPQMGMLRSDRSEIDNTW
jgi:hypothetical protein